jgi:RNA polymerase sigma-70 factor (ECF subfamily)
MVEVATTSAPYEPQYPHGRPDAGAAAARTEELYTRYGRTVSGLCRALLRDRAEAEDAAQQTFLSAHRALLNGTDAREPAAWLATIARNECWSRIRARMREPLPAEEVETASSAPDPLAEAIRRADLTALWAAIEELPRQQRDALLLREFGGLSYEELAEALAVSGPAVESLLFRARARLRVQLRAAYASLSGASWIEALVRLFAGGGAPVAAKVAALGVGAAAVGSSAVVVPHVFDNHTHLRPPARTPAAVQPKKHVVPVPVVAERAAPTTTAAAIVVRRPPTRTTAAPAPASPTSQERVSHEGDDRQEHRASGGTDDGSTSETEHPAKSVASHEQPRSGERKGGSDGQDEGGDDSHSGGDAGSDDGVETPESQTGDG